MTELLYKDETYAIVGAAMEVYSQLGCGFLEAIYQEALSIEFDGRGLLFQEQCPLQITYKQKPLQKKYIADYVVCEKIIVEIKAMKKLGPVEDAQLLNYLKATGLRLGLLINFGGAYKLDWKRLVL